MKRLPSAKELHVRCLTIPAVACAVGFLVSLILLAIFAAVYHHGVPARGMPPAETLQIWEAYFCCWKSRISASAMLTSRRAIT